MSIRDDDADDDGGDGAWMTYGELAVARGIKRVAAIRLVQRHRWRRQAGNDGLARVLVPHDMAKPATPGNSGGDIADDTAEGVTDDIAGDNISNVIALQAAIDALQEAHAGEIANLREEHGRLVAAIEGRATAAEARTDRLDQALVGERTRADSLRDRLDAAERGQRQAQQTVEALRQAEAARKARGLWQRLSAAVRGD